MKHIVLTALREGKSITKKPITEVCSYLHPLKYLFTTNEKGNIVANDNPFWSEENAKNRNELIADIKAIHKRTIRDCSYFHIQNRLANGDGYGIIKAFYETIEMKKEEYDRVNALMEIEDLCVLEMGEEEMDEEEIAEKKRAIALNAKEDDFIPLFHIPFCNGNYITLDVCSGGSNYYDNVILYSKNGNEVTTFDCSYALSETNEFTDGNETYIVNIKLINSVAA